MTTATPFIGIDDLSNYIGRDVTLDAGAVIAVDAACDMCRGIANQNFNETSETVTLDGTGTDCLLLPEYPVSAAGTVVLSGGTLTYGSDYVLADERKLIRMAGEAWSTTISGDLATWPLGRQNVVVTYEHGWAGTVPNDVRMVALQFASRIVVQGIASSETVAGQSITYAAPALDPTPGERLILSRYRSY